MISLCSFSLCTAATLAALSFAPAAFSVEGPRVPAAAGEPSASICQQSSQSPAPSASSSPGIAEFQFSADGIEIDAGSLGKFTLEYPSLLDAAQNSAHKLLEKILTPGRVALKYDSGLEAEITRGDDGSVRFRFSTAPADVKFVGWGMHIPISFNQGGKWALGDKAADFPKEKPPQPHLFQGNAKGLRITNYEGKSLAVELPPYTYYELNDNREWNWAIFHLKGVTPVAPEVRDFVLHISTQEAAAKAAPLVDAFGQSTRENWPGKVKSLEELKGDVDAENEYDAALHPPALGTYGGLHESKDGAPRKAAGFFRLEKEGERWLLIDPAGDPFFQLALCSAQPGEDYTLVKGRESAYEWLPPRDGEFATAWQKDSGGTAFSFLLANIIRKYHEPYDPERYTARMITRARRWGFNSTGAFTGNAVEGARRAANFPGVEHLDLGAPHLPGLDQVCDPFDEKVRQAIDQSFARTLPPRASDELIIGYFIANEPIYENIQHIVPALKASEHVCKQRLVDELRRKYATPAAFNAAWSLRIKAFDELGDMVVPVETPAAKKDVQDYVGLFLEQYFKIVSEAFRRHDAHHLLLGSRLMPGTINNEQLCRIMGKYVDVMSFNYYTKALDPGLLKRIYQWTGRPLLLSEFYWSASRESGLTGGLEVPTQRDRGLAYRAYVEQSAALGFVVGIEWFTLNDQAVTGRWFEGLNGERANTGVVAVTDRPWKPALTEMMKTNYDIYKILFGEKSPYVVVADH